MSYGTSLADAYRQAGAYRGAGPALVDLLAGQVDLGPISAVVATPLVNSDKLKAYALIGKNTRSLTQLAPFRFF